MSNSSEDSAAAAENPSASKTESSAPQPAEGLPEIEPLTPELVEDEALRGDFMLRAFILVLAALLAFTEIAETSALLHVKTGQYLAAHGWLPSGKDVFSLTAEGRPWYNLSWLFDLALAGAFAVGGAKALTVLKAVIVAAGFFLATRCVRAGVSTWWGSIAAALALLACHPQFTALPEVVTFLGLGLVLWILHRWRGEESNRNLLWWLVPAFVLWSNLDNRVFLGLSLLALYAMGDLAGALVGASGVAQSERRRQLWLVLAASVAAACVNPFGWQTLLEPARLYGVEYPSFRGYYEATPTAVELQYFPLFQWSVLQRPHIVAGLVVVVSAMVATVLNRRQVDLGHVFMLFGFAAFATLASHELAAAALVACVVATINGQEWYRDSFSQEYSIEFKERLFSSGGRAVTVLALFAIASLASTGRLNDPAGRRVGWGFHPELEATITGLKQDTADAFAPGAFNFRTEQGDLLIWLDQKPFIDSRLSIYAGSGYDDLISLHDTTRSALRRRAPGQPLSGRKEVWKPVFDRFEIVRALPRLSGENPDYATFFSLQPPEWRMIRVGSMTASIYLADGQKERPQLAEFLKQHTLNLPDEAFRGEPKELEPRAGWPEPPTTMQSILSNPRQVPPPPAQRSLHFNRYLQQFQDPATGQIQAPPDLAAATAHLALRYANQALAQDPNCTEAFRVLGDAYAFLYKLELAIAGGNENYQSARRYRQTIASYNQAVQADPESDLAYRGLFAVYSRDNKLDLALDALRELEKIKRKQGDKSDDAEADFTRIIQAQEQLQPEVERRLAQIDVELAKGNPGGELDMFRVAQFAYQQGCIGRCLELLEQDRSMISERPEVKLFHGLVLHEVGRVQDAADVLQTLEGVAGQVQLPSEWHRPAAWARLANGDYKGAISVWSGWHDLLITRQAQPILIPLAVIGPSITWNPFQTQAVSGTIAAIRVEAAQTYFDIGLTQLEAGQLKQAADSFRKVVEAHPASGNRPVSEFYYFQLTGQRIDPPLPLDRIPLDPGEMFAPDEQPAPGQEEAAAPK